MRRPNSASRPVERVRTTVGGPPGAHRRKHQVRRLREPLDRRVERLVIGLQEVEAGGDPRIEALQDRKVLIVLDHVVTMQVIEKPARHPIERPGVRLRIAVAVEESPGVLDQHPVHPPEAEVSLQPEAGEIGEMRMRLPADPRIALDQQPQRVGQPVTHRQRQRVAHSGRPCAASQAFSVRFFTCARQTRSMLARAHPASTRSGRASTSGCGR